MGYENHFCQFMLLTMDCHQISEIYGFQMISGGIKVN